MRVSTSRKLAVYILKDIEREGGDLLLYDFYPSISDAVQAAKQHLSNHHLKGVYQVNIYQDGKAWNRTVKA